MGVVLYSHELFVDALAIAAIMMVLRVSTSEANSPVVAHVELKVELCVSRARGERY